MQQVGNGLHEAKHLEEALSVKEAELAMMRRTGATEYNILVSQMNLASTYHSLGRFEEALQLERDVYHASLRLLGEEDEKTLRAAYNYANALVSLKRFEEAKALFCKTIPVARRVLGENDETTLKMRSIYAKVLYRADDATLDDLREAVTTLEDTERTARRVLGGTHPVTTFIECHLRNARAALAARDGDVSSVCEAMGAMMSA